MTRIELTSWLALLIAFGTALFGHYGASALFIAISAGLMIVDYAWEQWARWRNRPDDPEDYCA